MDFGQNRSDLGKRASDLNVCDLTVTKSPARGYKNIQNGVKNH